MRADEAVGLFADDARLRVMSALVLSAGTTRDIATRSGVPLRQAIETLARLEAVEVAHRDGQAWVFNIAPIRDAARTARPDPAAPPETTKDAVLRSFVVDGRLVKMPAVRSKRLIVLDRLAAEFEPGQTYDEPAVNHILRDWNDDVAALRRYLVDEGFLSRDHGSYWRTSVSVEDTGQSAAK